MRIAFYLGSFPETSETFIVRQIAAMVERGHDVTILAQRPGETQTPPGQVQELRLLERTHYWPRRSGNRLLRWAKGLWLLLANLPHHPQVFLRAINPLRYGRRAISLDLVYGAVAALRHEPFDVIHCHFGPAARLATMLRETGALRGPLLVTFHGSEVLKLPIEVARRAYASVFRTAACCTVGSRFMQTRLREMGVSESNFHLLPMGIDLSDFAYRSPRDILGDDRVQLLSVARLVDFKGIEFAIRAVAQLATSGVPLDYTIVGDGPLRADLRRLTQQLGVSNHITFVGALPVEQVRERLAAADLFIMPSTRDSHGGVEAQGVALLEAEAIGLPVVATNLGGLPDGAPVENQRYVVPAGDADALAEALRALIAAPHCWPAIAQAGRRHVEQHFDLARLNDRLEALYAQIVAESIPADGSRARPSPAANTQVAKTEVVATGAPDKS